ncbi:MAG: hypothetical protein IJ343_08085 [Clostridia bacterium]|nr:hypothetical protein [Clostridia bacterium]
MKKALLLVTCLLLMLCLTGCGGVSPKTESEMQTDLAASGYLPEQGLTISGFVVDKRKTDTENKLDTVYVSFTAEGAERRYTLSCTLRYELYNEGWMLENVKTTSKAVAPVRGATDKQITEMAEGNDLLSNPTIISRQTDLAGLSETVVCQCSRTLGAQTDTWTATMHLTFDNEDDFEWWCYDVTVSDLKSDFDYSKLAGDYHYKTSLNPYITTDVTITPDGRFIYNISYNDPQSSPWDSYYLEYEKSGTATISDFVVKEINGFYDMDFAHVFLVGDSPSAQEGFLLYRGQFYHANGSNAGGSSLSNMKWSPTREYTTGGWEEITW